MGKRSHDEEQPQYGPHDDLNNYFTFRVHHGGEFDVSIGDGLATGVGDVPTKAFVDGPNEDRNRTSRVNEKCDEALIGESADKVGERRNKGKHIAEEDIADDNEENDQLWDSDYDQEEEDIAAETCVDPTRDWDSLRILEFRREECGSGSDIDCASDDFRSLDGIDCEEDEGTKPRKFIKTKYHEFDPGRDIGNPIFRIGMVFASADNFRKAIRAHVVKHRFVNSKMIAEKYEGQWRENLEWNYAGMSQQLRTDTNVDASIWQYYHAMTISAAKSTTEQRFAQCMERMRSESVAAYEWLTDKDPHHWSRAYFKDTAVCDMLCNNMCEAFNKAILQARDKLVITHMEMIRNYLMKRLVKKRAELEKWTHDIGPNVFRIVEKLKMESSICQTEYNGNLKYQKDGTSFTDTSGSGCSWVCLCDIYNLITVIVHNRSVRNWMTEDSNGRIFFDPVIEMPENVRIQKTGKLPFHVALTATDAPYSKWQCRIMYYWYKKQKEQPGSEMGGFTRILHSGNPDNLMDEIPTVVVDPLPAGLDRVSFSLTVLF
ncbi:hypothetical protein EZV62_024990 [Acer yangbiense]|uniref:Hydroxyproline O-arabinosyltransferase-like domain-containing protein n=1 Tax=Acer yangbiense TaxID=1000413 RepID=A0A5C7GXB0_9ROSI|nr:hypothetical protein EZV62_024990 [Acer yangbiense]